MNRILLMLSFTVVFSIKLLACSFSPSNFCTTLNEYPDNVVFYGEILAVDRYELSLKVIKVLKGVEYRDVIKIREAEGFYCQLDYYELIPTSIGEVKDSIIISLAPAPGNPNGPIGHYLTPNFWSHRSVLKVWNVGVVVSMEEHYASANPEDWLLLSFDEINKVVEKGHCKEVGGVVLYSIPPNFQDIVPVARLAKLKVELSVTNPVINNLHVQLEEPLEDCQLNIYSIGGSKCLSMEINHKLNIDFSKYTQGMYLIELVKDNKHFKSVKFVKH